MEYLFGDSEIAAQRLEIVSQVFLESTKTFLLEAVPSRPSLAIDLGCGPGYSTHFLAKVLECERTVGLDNSENFISIARGTETEKVSFLLHDVTSVPFPVGPADLIYCRFLLTHLKNPEEAISKWVTQLRVGGLLLLEEVEWIDTDNAAFKTYLEIVEAMLESQSNVLYVGPVLERLRDTLTLRRRTSRILRLQVSSGKAAMMFHLNLQSWKTRPFVRRNHSSTAIKQLEQDLQLLAIKSNAAKEIEWGLRQVVFERA